jgi:hypothetical protein
MIFFKQTAHFFSIAEQESHNTDKLFNTILWHLIQFLVVCKNNSFEQVGHSITTILVYSLEIQSMELFFPFIHKKQEKEHVKQISLYIDDIPDIIEQKTEIEEPERIAIIEIL